MVGRYKRNYTVLNKDIPDVTVSRIALANSK